MIRVRLAATEHEIGHEILSGYHHVVAICGGATSVACGSDERSSSVTGNHIANKHRRAEQVHIDGKGVSLFHAQRSRIEHQIAAGQVGRSGSQAVTTETQCQLEQGGNPRRDHVVDDELANACFE